MVSTQNDISPLASVATIGPTFRLILHAAQVHRASSALSGAANYLYIIYEITFH